MSHPATQAKPSKAGHRSNGRGTLVIDRTFPAPIGRLRLASGTNDPAAKRDIEDMLTAMARSVPPRWDILQAIKAKRVAPLYALSLWRMDRLQEVPAADVLPMLGPLEGEGKGIAGRWLAGLQCSTEHRASTASTFRALLRLRPTATLGDLPELLEAYRVACQRRGCHVAFNRGRSHVEALVRDRLKPSHVLYRSLQDVRTLPVAETTRRRPQLPQALWGILQRLPAAHREHAWSMAASGMGPKEYWGRWDVLPDRLHIAGTKRASRVRDVPRWALVTLPTTTRGVFEDAWERCIGAALGIYDLRRSFALWIEEVGLPLSRQRLYMGHSARSTTELYTRRDLSAWLVGDAERLGRYVAGEMGISGATTPDFHPDRQLSGE